MPHLNYSTAEPAATSDPSKDKLTEGIEALQQAIKRSPPQHGRNPLIEELRSLAGHDALPDFGKFSELQYVLSELARKPLTKEDIKHLKDVARPFREEEARRKAVIADQRHKLKFLDHIDSQGCFADRKKRLEASITALLAVDEDERIWPAHAFGATKQYDPKTLTVRWIGTLLLEVLQSIDRNAGLPPRHKFSGAAIDWVRGKLEGRITATMPSREDIAEDLRQLEAELNHK
jgi:hypothetical protein